MISNQLYRAIRSSYKRSCWNIKVCSNKLSTAAAVESNIMCGSVGSESKLEISRLYELPKEIVEKKLTEGIPKRIADAFQTIGKQHILLRQPTLEIINEMKEWEKKPAAERSSGFIIDGERGIGKSTALLQVVQYARENNWIVLYIPRARSWCYQAPYVIKSDDYPGKFDIDEYGIDLLKQFRQSHAEQLEQIPLSKDYGTRYYPRSFKEKPKEFKKDGLTLLDLVENGINDELLACTAVVDLRNELAKVTKFPVLIAIDEINCWFRDTIFGYEGKPVSPTDIAVIDALLDLNENGLKEDKILKNGLFIGATTENFPSKYKFRSQVDYRKLRKTLKPYTKEELENIISYYKKSSFLLEDIDGVELTHFRLMTKAHPLRVFDRASIM